MTTAHLTRSLLSRSIALALCMPAAAALAQNAAPAGSEAAEMDTVLVTGVRASLGRAVDLKRGAGTVQDSISAVELGKFPDDNVADSLSHITGVAISRTAGGEGQKVSVRGLGPEYTLTTFNGRILATDGAGRDFAYDVLPADVISGADVRRLLPMEDCIPIVEGAMREVSRGGAQLPLRIGCVPPGTPNILAVMPGYLDEPPSIGANTWFMLSTSPRCARKV